MSLFSIVDGEVAILVENGVYKQVPIYTRNGYIFAKNGSGYVQLYANGSTSKPKCRLDTMTWDRPVLGANVHGRLCDPALVAGARVIEGPPMNKLLGVDE